MLSSPRLSFSSGQGPQRQTGNPGGGTVIKNLDYTTESIESVHNQMEKPSRASETKVLFPPCTAPRPAPRDWYWQEASTAPAPEDHFFLEICNNERAFIAAFQLEAHLQQCQGVRTCVNFQG